MSIHSKWPGFVCICLTYCIVFVSLSSIKYVSSSSYKIDERGSPCFKPIETSKKSDKLKLVDLTHEDNLLYIDCIMFTHFLLIPSFSSFCNR